MVKIKYILFRRILKPTIFSFSFLIIISCKKEKKIDLSVNNLPVNSNSNTNTTDTGVITYLALGDSYTIGQSVNRKDFLYS